MGLGVSSRIQYCKVTIIRNAKLWLFLPSALILLLMSITGFYLFLKVLPAKNSKRKRIKAQNQEDRNL